MVLLSELQLKEVVEIKNGKRLGHIADLEIDPDLGRIIAIIIYIRDKGSFFGKAEEIFIYWNQIVTIGTDVILVKDVSETQYYDQINTNYDSI
ncbi:YlmC/YmxH family sporulation protein [Virgibacillus soli]|uniref:YlmC/YmxH family sporulation protein n=1 Tax=Paracerasibacillus soli TaxID=480284 RepID=A0ABU5CP20_9BACI|nr:YlmC/YmxH family sporulation protein [Virgibacillus soli]MDY0408109.1 YlmC/YmxH family sporulation protein [Virgibacillus soli]